MKELDQFLKRIKRVLKPKRRKKKPMLKIQEPVKVDIEEGTLKFYAKKIKKRKENLILGVFIGIFVGLALSMLYDITKDFFPITIEQKFLIFIFLLIISYKLLTMALKNKFRVVFRK